MRSDRGRIILSPSDLMRFQGCEHASALDLRYARGEDLTPAEESADAALLQRKGDEHEAAYLSRLPPENVVEVARTSDFQAAARSTIDAMRSGAPVIYQGALATGCWQGWSDFLQRVDRPSRLGGYSYEVVDTKLKRRADPKHALQLTIYSKAVAEIQDVWPQQAHVELGSGERVSFPVSEARYYAERLAGRLESFIADPWTTESEPSSGCGLCRWRDICDAHYDATDSLVRVAGISRVQRQRLRGAGLDTLTALAKSSGRVPRMQPETLEKLRAQASLQLARRNGGQPAFLLKPVEAGRGFCRLPKASPGDMFFDLEGDPLIEGGLEYLFGLHYQENGGGLFKAWWAHDRDAERQATRSVLEFFLERLAAHPDAHIYHYNHYEVTALKRITQREGIGEAMLDHLLRTGRFVDLYRVVQQGLLASEGGYSLKDLEAFYREKREGDVATAGDSIVAYETWLVEQDPAILEGIERYNEVDCVSTRELRDWLISIRPRDAIWFESASVDKAPSESVDFAREQLRAAIAVAAPRLGESVADVLFEINAFHKRADKPVWWEYFERQNRDVEELIDDLESLGGLKAAGRAEGQERVYSFPHQETKIREGMQVAARGLQGTVTVETLDRRTRKIRLKFPRKITPLPDTVDLIPGGPLNTDVLQQAIGRVTLGLIKSAKSYPAISHFLTRRAPRLRKRAAGSPVVGDGEIVTETVAAIADMEDTCLPIQGPPGTGKTYVSACAIVDLVKRGKRVAISSNAHKAIDNLLLAVAARAQEEGLKFTIVKKAGGASDDPGHRSIVTVSDNKSALLHDAPVVGGTAWLFARPEFESRFDYVFIDEAGQVSIANLVAIASAAKNIVLVGDQMQLPQPVQGVHPGESGLSTLDYLLGEQRTVAADRGIFLPVSRRMHPAVCKIVSDLVYDGKLSSDADAGRHQIEGVAGLPPSGVLFEEIAHVGNSQSSEEEAERLAEVYASLIGATFTDRKGKIRKIGVSDILVVSPYNAQVNLLTEKLPSGARVGTVDRFQGQEAPACLISMATSSGEELPRDVEFLFSLNRLNVAISRAQALAVVFASPRLLDVSCSTLEELRLVNALCAVRDYALRAGRR